jgi:hypothetical protein
MDQMIDVPYLPDEDDAPTRTPTLPAHFAAKCRITPVTNIAQAPTHPSPFSACTAAIPSDSPAELAKEDFGTQMLDALTTERPPPEELKRRYDFLNTEKWNLIQVLAVVESKDVLVQLIKEVVRMEYFIHSAKANIEGTRKKTAKEKMEKEARE